MLLRFPARRQGNEISDENDGAPGSDIPDAPRFHLMTKSVGMQKIVSEGPEQRSMPKNTIRHFETIERGKHLCYIEIIDAVFMMEEDVTC